MDENHLRLIREANRTVSRYHHDPDGFMKQLVEDHFNVSEADSAKPESIWDHFSAFTSDPHPENPFPSHYQNIFRTQIPKNRNFWKNYLEQIHDFLGFLDKNEPARYAIRDRALYSYAERQGLSEEDLQELLNAPSEAKSGLLDKLLKNKKNLKEPYSGSLAPVPLVDIKFPDKSHPPFASTAEHQKLQDLGLEERHEPAPLTTVGGDILTSQGTENAGQKFLTNAQGERLTTAGAQREPGILVGPTGEPLKGPVGRKILLGPSGKPLSPGLEVIHADETPGHPNPGKLALPLSQVLHPSENTREVLTEASKKVKHGLIMGSIKTVPAVENMAGGFARSVLREAGSLVNPSGGQTIYVQNVSVPYESSSSRGGIPGTTTIPRVIRIAKNVRRVANAAKAARAAGAAAEAAEAAGAAGAAAAAPVVGGVALVIIIILLVLAVLIFLGSDNFKLVQNTALCGLPDNPCGKSPSQTVETQNIVSIFKTAPQAVDQGAAIAYNIVVTYTGEGVADVQVTDSVPAGTTFSSYAPSDPAIATFDGTTITWKLNNIRANTPQVFYLTVVAPTADTWIQNTATAKVTNTSLNTLGPTPPNDNNCNGEWGPDSYFGRFPANRNFGDPNCDFTTDALQALLQELDPINASYWYDTVIRCESGYDPNAYNPSQTGGTFSWGLYQLDPSPPSTAPDIGNVTWQQQTQYAIDLEKQLESGQKPGGPWSAWPCAN